MAESQVRQLYHCECEDGVNKQINLELYAMYTYLSMVSRSSCVSKLSTSTIFLFTFSSFVLIYLAYSSFPSLTTSNATMLL